MPGLRRALRWTPAEEDFRLLRHDGACGETLTSQGAAGMATGTVKWSAITSGGYRSLQENQKVQFDIVQGQKGPQAENISPL